MSEIYGEFCTDAVGRSVMLSSLLSAILRAVMSGDCPLHCFDGSAYGVGKSMLAEIVGVVAMGIKPPMTPPGETKEETMKRVEAVTRSGDPIIVLDNMSQPLTGDALCVLMTAEWVNVRIFGTNVVERLHQSAFWMTTGQNITVSADMVRRTVSARIDPGVERPELSSFKKADLVGWVRANRMEILSKIFLILRAHIQHGFPYDGETLRLGSFSDWALRIAGCCTWLGYVSPMQSQERLHNDDPVRSRRASTLNAIYQWQQSQSNPGKPWFAAKLLEDALDSMNGHQGLFDFIKNELRGKDTTPIALSGWFRKVRDQVTDGKKITSPAKDGVSKTVLWFVECVGDSPVISSDSLELIGNSDLGGGFEGADSDSFMPRQ